MKETWLEQKHTWHRSLVHFSTAKTLHFLSAFLNSFTICFNLMLRIDCKEFHTFQRLNLVFSIWCRWEISTKEKAGWRCRGITWENKARVSITSIHLEIFHHSASTPSHERQKPKQTSSSASINNPNYFLDTGFNYLQFQQHCVYTTNHWPNHIITQLKPIIMIHSFLEEKNSK